MDPKIIERVETAIGDVADAARIYAKGEEGATRQPAMANDLANAAKALAETRRILLAPGD